MKADAGCSTTPAGQLQAEGRASGRRAEGTSGDDVVPRRYALKNRVTVLHDMVPPGWATPTGVWVMDGPHAVGDLGVLEAAFAAIEHGVTIHDRDGRVVVCNPAAARLI